MSSSSSYLLPFRTSVLFNPFSPFFYPFFPFPSLFLRPIYLCPSYLSPLPFLLYLLHFYINPSYTLSLLFIPSSCLASYFPLSSSSSFSPLSSTLPYIHSMLLFFPSKHPSFSDFLTSIITHRGHF